MINKISSKDNQKIKELIKLRDDSKERFEKSLFYVEGERIINDTPTHLLKRLYIKESLFNKFDSIINKNSACDINILPDGLYEKVKDTINSQGIIAVVKKQVNNDIKSYISLNKNQQILVIDNIQDPGNLGTILRVAEAANFFMIVLSSDTCDVYNTKCIRSSMSSIFRLNIYISHNLTEDIKYIKDNDYKVYASALCDNSEIYNKIKYNNKSALIIGNEGSGIKKEIIDMSDKIIKIPMKGKIESLNVSVATGILCYEIFNQLNNNESQ